MLWLVILPMILIAAAGLALPLIRPGRDGEAAPATGLKERLEEIARQAEAGEIDTAQARALTLEAERRILAEARDTTADRPLGTGARKAVAGALAVLTVVAGAGLYGLLGRPDMSDREAVVAAAPDDPLARMTAALEDRARQTPDDPELLRLLGLAYGEAGRFDEAAQALARAETLAPDDPRIPAARGEALVQAAEGVVTDAALAAFRRAAEGAPDDPRVRYFLALRREQTGDPDGALEDWIALINDAPADAPWLPQVRSVVERAAAERGVSLEGRLPPAPATVEPQG